MKILLVEDETPKRKHIESYIHQIFSEGVYLNISKSVTSAVQSLENDPPDLILLDMSLPTYDVKDTEAGWRPQGFGGIEIMRYMINLGLKRPVIVITGYEAFPRGSEQVDLSDLEYELKEEFGEMVEAILHYNSTYDEWKDRLLKALTEGN